MNNSKASYNMLTVYLGSSGKARDVFKNAASDLGRIIAESGRNLVYGGMDAGLMGILAQNALDAGGHVTGIIPRKIKDSERVLNGLSKTIFVEDLCDRKKQMFLMADAIISLPGGFGTLDESLEALYWGALGLHAKPLVLVNIEGYWDSLITYIEGLSDFDPRFLIIVDSVEEIIPALEAFEPLPDAETPPHLPHFEDEITRDTDQAIVLDKANIENSYFMVCAMGLKQLGKHNRALGFLNADGQFDGLLAWFKRAEREHFITPKCLQLYSSHENEDMLHVILKNQERVEIDLHAEKWGKSAV
ncbi:MAG: TIGR00730 family Rossman fold protein [Pseudomonadota bacterium]